MVEELTKWTAEIADFVNFEESVLCQLLIYGLKSDILFFLLQI